MNFLFKRGFIVGFLPGFLFISGVIFIYTDCTVKSFLSFGQNISVSFGIGIVIFSFIIGQVFDSLRDGIIEDIYYDRWRKKNLIFWGYFSMASQEEIDKLDENYYIWYDLNINLVVCTSVLLVLHLLNWSHILPIKTLFKNPLAITIIFLLAIIVLCRDFTVLREEISTITQKLNRGTDQEE